MFGRARGRGGRGTFGGVLLPMPEMAIPIFAPIPAVAPVTPISDVEPDDDLE